MEFGFALPGRGPLAKPDLVLRMAARAEALRYDSVFVTDHVVLPASMARSVYPYSTTGRLAGGAARWKKATRNKSAGSDHIAHARASERLTGPRRRAGRDDTGRRGSTSRRRNAYRLVIP